MKFAHQSATIRQHGKGMIILETALETAGLTYVFPDGNGIKNIAFQVKRGEIYALYGGHHAGKSVLLQTIIGTLRPQAGTLKLFGNIDYQKERRRIGFVPQKPVTIGSLSPADMLRYFSSVFGTTEIHILDILHLNLKEKKMDSIVQKSNIQIANNHIMYDTARTAREIAYNTLIIPAGFTYNVTLADGTEVTLNAGSRLKYPEEFVGDSREVELSGEAYFNVTKSGQPFVVNIDGSKIRVYGTRFNVKGRSQKTVETVLIEGKIGFKSPGRDEIQVVPGEQVAYNVGSGDIKVERVDVQYATAWLNNVFRYRDKPLDLVLEDISTWYGVEFEARTELARIEITMNLSKETPIDEVIQFLEEMTDCKFIKERGHYIVK